MHSDQSSAKRKMADPGGSAAGSPYCKACGEPPSNHTEAQRKLHGLDSEAWSTVKTTTTGCGAMPVTVTIVNDAWIALNRDLAQARAQLEEARKVARIECAEYDDTDYPEDLHLADVIEKHLARSARARIESARRDGLKRGAELAVETLEGQRDKFAWASEEYRYLNEIIDGLRVGLAIALANVAALNAADAAGQTAQG